MLDYIESRIARQEYEQRVRSHTPVRDHAAWLKDDRQLSIWPIRAGIVSACQNRLDGVSKPVSRLLSRIGGISLGKRVQQDVVLEVSLEDSPC